jgi:hypothetical protein
MRQFKFLSDDVEDELIIDEGYEGASWIFGRPENLTQYQYDIVRENHYGIHSFLNHFPPGFIVTILSITGPNNRIHTDLTEYEDGWGFDITTDLITIEWVRFTH